jgi:hypothetical protein
MIERLVLALCVLARADAADVAGHALKRAAGDYADALRLTLDCPQLRLDGSDRAVLESVELELDRLERLPGGIAAARAAERAAVAARARRAVARMNRESASD